MDGRLNPTRATRAARWAWRRRAAFAGVAVLVVLLHLALTRALADQMGNFDPARAMPQRMTAAYVRTIEPTAPAPAAAVAVAPMPARRTARAATRPPPAASAASASAAAVRPAAEPLRAQAAASPASEPAEAPLPEVAAATSDPAAAASAAVTALAAADAASAPTPSGYQWPASTRLSYDLTGNYRGELSGQAQVEWLRRGDRYQVHLDLSAGPEFAPIFSRRMSSEGRIEASGLVPERYDEDTQAILRERRRATVLFEADSVVLANGQRRERLAGVQDTASQFVQFSFVFSTRPELLRVGNTFELPLALPRGMEPWTYDVLEEVTLATPFGPLAAFHLKPRRALRKNGELTAEIWFAPELRYLPVRIRIQQDASTFIDLTIARKPEMAAS